MNGIEVPLEQLKFFLLRRFSASELRRLVMYTPGCGHLNYEMETNVSPKRNVEVILDLLVRDGLLDKKLFERFVDRRPVFKDRWWELARQLGVDQFDKKETSEGESHD